MVSVALTVILWLCVAVSRLASVTCTVKLDVPVPVGVPLISPLELFSVSPAGNEPVLIDQVYGPAPPLAVRVCE